MAPQPEPPTLATHGLRTPPNLDRAAKLLWLPVPEPYRPPPKPQKTWKTLTAGRVLQLKVTWWDGHTHWPAGTQFMVEDPTSAGISLRPHLTGPNEAATLSISWTHPDWRETFEVVRRTRRKKTK